MIDDAGGKSALSEGLGVVERLRLIAAWHLPAGPTPRQKQPRQYETCTEAANEIERLRALLGRIRQWDALDTQDTDGAFWKREIDVALGP